MARWTKGREIVLSRQGVKEIYFVDNGSLMLSTLVKDELVLDEVGGALRGPGVIVSRAVTTEQPSYLIDHPRPSYRGMRSNSLYLVVSALLSKSIVELSSVLQLLS